MKELTERLDAYSELCPAFLQSILLIFPSLICTFSMKDSKSFLTLHLSAFFMKLT